MQESPVDAQWIFLTGENGYGKTSLLQCLTAGLWGNRDDKEELLSGNPQIGVEIKMGEKIESKIWEIRILILFLTLRLMVPLDWKSKIKPAKTKFPAKAPLPTACFIPTEFCRWKFFSLIRGQAPDEELNYTGEGLGSDHSFAGRTELMHWLRSLWKQPEGKPAVVLVGQRRMGKTSLLNKIARDDLTEAKLLPLIISIQDIASDYDFLSLTGRKMVETLNIEVPHFDQKEPYTDFRNFLLEPTYRFTVPLYRRWIAWRWRPEKVKQEAL